MTAADYALWEQQDKALLMFGATMPPRAQLFNAMREDEIIRDAKGANHEQLRHFHGLSPQDELPMREAQERMNARIES